MKKTALTIILFTIVLGNTVYSQGYANIGYSLKVQKGAEDHGAFFGGGATIDKYSVGFIADLYDKKYAIASLDLRREINEWSFVSIQPGWVLFDDSKVDARGGFSGSLLLGAKYKFLVLMAGYQSETFRIMGDNVRANVFKVNLGFTIH